MRDIEFRGYSKTKKSWIYGLPSYYKNEIYGVQTKQRTTIHIDTKTLGQYTGTKDINDTKIYEGDIVKHLGGMTGRVYYDEAETSYILEPADKSSSYEVLGLQSELQVLGNEFENPELITNDIKEW